MSVSEPFIRRPIATSLLMLGVLVFGIAAYGLLPVAALPNVDFPTITVTANFPGASPATMASSVATPLEQQFTSIPALDQMTSLSGVGTTTITLQFDLSRNIDAAAQDVQTAINAASGLLPKDLPNPPTYKKVNPANFPVLIYAVYSNALPVYRIDDYANTVLAQRLSTVSGVSQVFIFGQKQFAARVQINPGALAAHGLGLEDVRNALAAATVDLPTGEIEGAHQAVSFDTNDQLFNAAAYGNVIIAFRNGAPIRIKDVGDAVNSVQNTRIGAWYDDTPAEGLAIQRADGANTLQLVDKIKAMMPQLEASIPPSVKVSLMSDRSLVTRAAVHDVQLTMMVTIGLVILVIFLFLRTVWATIIPSMAVPLSLLATFAVMYAAGYSLDNISLMALTISVGFIVDDAIVMIENISRYIEQGYRPMEAALKGAGQIGFTIISITFSLIAVFIPLFFMGGIIGRLFREFAVTVSVAVVASAAISLTLTPVLCSLFLKEKGLHPTGRFNRIAEAGFDWMLASYDRGLRFVFRHQFPTLLATLTLIFVTGYLYVQIPKGFFPQQDTGFIFGEVDTREDASFLSTAKIRQQIVDIVRKDPAVAGVFSFAGAYSYNPTENTARVFMQLKPFDERDVSADQVIARLRPKMAAVQGAKFFMQAGQEITIGGRLSRTQYQYTLTDTDLAELNHWAPVLEHEMQKLPELQDVASDQQIAAPHMAIDIDRDAASRLGISAQEIDETLYDAFGQRQVATIYTSTNQYKVVLEVQPQFQTDRNALSKIYVPGAGGAQVPLSAFAHYASKLEALSVSHQGVFPAVTLSFNLAPGVALGQAVDKIQAVAARLGAPATLNGSFQGTAQAFQASLSSMPLLVAAAILVVYIVLGILYESYIHPITILSALPSAGVGALLALMLLHYDLTVIAMIGVILLIGIVKKNAIMMIDFALQAERIEGKSPREAIHEACLLRFRPIMMTTFAALFGGLPIALGHGAGSELRRPLGIAIVGGLLVSQWLTLYTTPVVYLYLERFARWVGRPYRPSRTADILSGEPGPALAQDRQGAE
ncbi:MAG TPA: efflux RND transporter permease subunit [Stellaceae bacterium]|jgi:hydrophobe/amphiphile efflux-1 (HAE1) family protein|nr:efflux RND transporter permease subunit [Stellaceae bacterium]